MCKGYRNILVYHLSVILFDPLGKIGVNPCACKASNICGSTLPLEYKRQWRNIDASVIFSKAYISVISTG